MGGAGGVAAATATVAAAVELRDIAGHWAEQAIRGAVGKQYVDGYQDGTFLPDRQVSRAEFAKLAVTALKLPVSGSTSGSDWYQGYVNAAVSAGIHKWNDFAAGDWNTPMTRQEMARMAVRAAGRDTEDGLEWMFLATKAGLIQGVDDTGSLDVDGTTTRAQSVTIIERILTVKEGRGAELAGQADKRAVSRAEVLWHKTNLESMLDGDYIDVAGTPERERLDLSKAKAEAYNGNLKGWAEGLYVVDLDDPNDPYRYLLEGAKMYYVPESGPIPEQRYFDVPNKGAYAVVCVSTVSMKENPDSLDLHLFGSSYLRVDLRPDYGYSELYTEDGRLATSATMVYYNDGKRVYVGDTRFSANTRETKVGGGFLPKLPSKRKSGIYSEYFKIDFEKFSSFGQYPETVGKYKLHSSRM